MISFSIVSINSYVTSVGFSIILYGPLRSGGKFLEVLFCVVKLGIKTNVPIFKSLAGVKHELIWVFMFCLCSNFLKYFLINFIVFLSLFKIHSAWVPEAKFKICG